MEEYEEKLYYVMRDGADNWEDGKAVLYRYDPKTGEVKEILVSDEGNIGISGVSSGIVYYNEEDVPLEEIEGFFD